MNEFENYVFVNISRLVFMNKPRLPKKKYMFTLKNMETFAIENKRPELNRIKNLLNTKIPNV